MRLNKRITRLEVNQKSAVGLHHLNNAQLHQFARLVEKSKNVTDYDALTDYELERLSEFWAILNSKPPSRAAQRLTQRTMELSDAQFEEFTPTVAAFEQTRQRFDWQAEINREYLRRKNFN